MLAIPCCHDVNTNIHNLGFQHLIFLKIVNLIHVFQWFKNCRRNFTFFFGSLCCLNSTLQKHCRIWKSVKNKLVLMTQFHWNEKDLRKKQKSRFSDGVICPDTKSIPPHPRKKPASVRRSSLPYSPVVPSVSCWGGDACTTFCVPHQEQWKSELFLERWSSADGSSLNNNWLNFWFKKIH